VRERLVGGWSIIPVGLITM